MDQKDKVRSLAFLLEGVDLSQENTAKGSFPLLNKVIAEGNSTLIVDENKVSKANPIISVLSFGNTYSNGFEENVVVKEGTFRVFEQIKSGKQNKGGDDEEIIEVKYISHPKKFSELAEAFVVVITDSEKVARFCEVSEINYLYQKDGYNVNELRKQIGNDRVIDLLVVHREIRESKRVEALNWVEEFFAHQGFEYDFLRIISSPFGESLSLGKLLQKHEEQIADKQEIQDKLKSIVPSQTWQYYRGKTVLNKAEIQNVMVMITNRKELNRADKIQTINDYVSEENIGKFGGKVIHSFGVLREVFFELGKLPKFGA